MTTDRDHFEPARTALTDPEFRLWGAKHVYGYGRRSGSLALGISEDAWRYRLNNADRKVAAALEQQDTADAKL